MSAESGQMPRHRRPWVPADRRWFGLDRKTLLPAGIVLATVIVMHWAVPALNDAVSYSEQVRAGQTITLGNGVRITPPTGWGIEEGLVTGGAPSNGIYPEEAEVVSGATSITVRTDKFTGTPAALLRQIRALDAGRGSLPLSTQQRPVTTDSGLTGIVSPTNEPQSNSSVTVFTADGVGIEVIVRTPAGTPPSTTAQIDRTIASITKIGDER